MKIKIKNLKQYTRLSLAIVLLAFTPIYAEADTATLNPSLVFSEIKIKNDTAGYNEFIELYNASINDVSLANYTLEYFNVHNPTPDQQPTRALIANGILPAGQSYVLATEPTQIPMSSQLPFSSLKDTEGLVRIIDARSAVIDQIAWTSTQGQALQPIVYMPNTGAASSLARTTNERGVLIVDPTTWQLGVPTPVSIALNPLPPPEDNNDDQPDVPPDDPAEEPSNPNAPGENPLPETTETTETASALLPIQISELFPNPALPLTDTADEFVELYNPNSEPIELAGYKLQTGTNYSYTYTFANETISPNGYLILTSGNSGLVLANSAGRARLLNPEAQIISESNPYTDADEGNAWALINGSWQWTTTPTPNAPNVLTAPITLTSPVKPAKSVAAKKTPSKKTSVKTASVKKTKAASTKAVKTSNSSSGVGENLEEAPATQTLHSSVIAGVAILALLYGAYEYRTDMANFFYKLRRNRATRRASRQES